MPEMLDFSAEFWQVRHLLTDSRYLIHPESTLFFAMRGQSHDGHAFIAELYAQGVRRFVVEAQLPAALLALPGIRIYQATSSLQVLQALAAAHRRHFTGPVIGITGSNGKTIVKEWLAQLVETVLPVAKSPKSYNSQLGVPLSVWGLSGRHGVGIFEAGISQRGEMARLEEIIRPDIGLMTNLGTAHDEGFGDRREKLREKLLLFRQARHLIYCTDHPDIAAAVKGLSAELFGWGSGPEAAVRVQIRPQATGTEVAVAARGHAPFVLQLPFRDQASVENALHCLTALLLLASLGVLPMQDMTRWQAQLALLPQVPMRLEVRDGLNGSRLIADAYNNDLAGLQVALEFMAQHAGNSPRTVLLSDFLQTGRPVAQHMHEVGELLRAHRIDRLIGVGVQFGACPEAFGGLQTSFWGDTATLVAALQAGQLAIGQEIILLKGATGFGFDKIASLLQAKQHGTRLDISLDALAHNLNLYRSLLSPGTRIMVMVKALAYGSGGYEVARFVQHQGVDYLAVAYADEGVELRQKGIRLPIMVMNPAPEVFDLLLEHRLEPEVYSVGQFDALVRMVEERKVRLRIHVKIDTGMRRLGFLPEEVAGLAERLAGLGGYFEVASVFSHLAGADEARHHDFTREQIRQFEAAAAALSERLGYTPLRHLLNSPGITRFADAQQDMVRLGIGLYGIDPNGLLQAKLKTVATLRTTISQIKYLQPGETVGYGRHGLAVRPTTIATIAIGYADGYDRRFSKGVGEVLVHGRLAPVIGNVCMDMTMIDITGIPAREGDEVILFGEEPHLITLAERIGTIPYELLTGVGHRVKRVFHTE